MSTKSSSASVKQGLMITVQQCQKLLEELAEALPDQLEDLEAAEEMVRDGVLKPGCRMR